IGERRHGGVHAGDAGFVVEVARANEAGIADLDARVEDDKITDLNAERARLVGRGGAGVDAHLVTVLVALELAGVAAVDVDRSLAGDDRAAIGPAIVGVDSDTFTLNGAPGPAAKLGELQAAIRLHLADHRAEGVDVGGQPTRGVVPRTLPCADERALAGACQVKRQLAKGRLTVSDGLFVKAGRAGD